jgi:hypothetical protein
MGIQFFSKVFRPYNTIKLKELSGRTIAIDAMTEIYRAVLGSKSVGMLTDKNGNNTMHINVIMANIIEMQKLGIKTIWVFDHVNSTEEKQHHNPDKANELLKRRQRKDEAKEQLKELQLKEQLKDKKYKNTNTSTEEILLDDDLPNFSNIPSPTTDKKEIELFDEEEKPKSTKEKKDQLEKQIFTVDKALIDDVKFILNCFSIKYIESPAGFEAEQIASHLTIKGECDGVYSGDTDPIAFGAKFHFRKSTKDKVLYCYSQEDILSQISKETKSSSSLNDIQKICVILGCDFAKKTPKIGPKTVIAKYKNVSLTDEQKKAMVVFNKDMPSVDIINKDKVAFEDNTADKLYSWLTEDKSFNPLRIKKWLDKINITIE